MCFSAIVIIFITWLKVFIIISNSRDLIFEYTFVFINFSNLISMNIFIKDNLKFIFSRLRIFIFFVIMSQHLFFRWRIATIKSQRKCIIQHLGNDITEYWWWQFKTRVCIDFNKVAFVIFINHNIKSKNFKVTWSSTWIYKIISSMNNISWDLSDLW